MEGSTDAGRIERDLEQTRSRIDSTIDALQQKLSPGEMVDQAMTYFKEGGGVDFSRNLARSVRDNPVPVALIGIGLGWLMVTGSRRGNSGAATDRWQEPDMYGRRNFGGGDAYRRSAAGELPNEPAYRSTPYAAAAYDDLATKAHEAGARVDRMTGEADEDYHDRVYAAKGTVVGITRQVGEAAASFRQRVEQAIASAAERVRQMSHEVGSMASDAASSAGSLAGDLGERGQAGLRSMYGYGHAAAAGMREGADYAIAQARDMGSRTTSFVQDQPLVIGALGLAVGAALGILLPASRYERRVLGDVRQDLRDGAGELVRDVQHRVARVAETVIDTAQEAARREGFDQAASPSGLAAAARDRVADAAGRARNVVEETAAAGREALKRELSGTEPKQGESGRAPSVAGQQTQRVEQGNSSPAT